MQIWHSNGDFGILGHSFRVGGASLRAALGIPHSAIKTLGRWTSACYALYLRDYSSEDMAETCRLLEVLNG
ncbi:uncharacterized protein MELLADRAFT_87573 [Melampsora larici-populina 98AG31]|uniref:Tyr recombinase domain-containing protein n=1 Tax=Melampsora larici-populina (strain 98AG31 / pathotype 3-4-7) TaxID=747676 RepID=F4SDW9_MELLP|nr:uncharacterized protein MELLADRAFT_87573 [Melampsora larici-populina 98AG31]EGF97157.1 hypothetical protein MELLADRAFT_87573 [Melampsora larici-populina 98AG31]